MCGHNAQLANDTSGGAINDQTSLRHLLLAADGCLVLNPVMRILFLSLWVVSGLFTGFSKAEQVAAPAAPAQVTTHNFGKWAGAVAAFAKADAANLPPKHAVLFIGASTIVRWKSLAEDFKGTVVLNRGFGGNEIVDSTHYADQIIFPYEPKMIFLRAGGNDIHAGHSPEEVFGDFKDFVSKVREHLPEVPIAYIALSPSIARWNEREKGDKLNTLIADYIKQHEKLIYVDDGKISLGADGQPRPELFVEDKLHFSEAGYKLLADVVRPYLPK